MITYGTPDLEQYIRHSSDAFGLFDPDSLLPLYTNESMLLRLETLHKTSGRASFTDWPHVQEAAHRSLSSNTLICLNCPEHQLRIEFMPVGLQQTDGSVLTVLHCRLLSHEPTGALLDNSELSQMLDCNPHSCWASTAKGKVFWNNRSSKLYRYGTLASSAHNSPNDLTYVHPDDLKQLLLNFNLSSAEGCLKPQRYRLRSHQGHYEWFLFSGAPVRSDNGDIRYWTGSSINIQAFVEQEERDRAEIARLQHLLQEAQAVAAAAQKIELVSHLAGGVAHDLNNLLFVMGMQLGSLHGKLSTDEQRKYLSTVRDCIRKASRLSDQLLGFSGRLPQRPTTLNPETVIEDAQSLFSQATGAEVRFSTWLATDLPCVFADRAYLENALLNLLINARDAVHGRGKVELSVSTAQAMSKGHPQTFVSFTVKDDGSGMSPEVQSRIFEPFFTTKQANKGTGLGLAMVKNFAESSGGLITVQSSPEHGTTMSLLLPVSDQAPDLTSLATEPAYSLAHLAERYSREHTILLVEDNVGVREAMGAALQDMGYTMLTADDPERAVHLLDSGLRPDVIISDIRMPGHITAQDFVSHVDTTLNIPMIFITGYSADLVKEEGLQAGKHPVLFKPLDMDELMMTIEELIPCIYR